MTAWRAVDGGLIVAVRVTPRSSREAVEGLVDVAGGGQALAVRVRAAPADGEANDAVLRVLAARLDLPVRAVRLLSGATARLKQVSLEGPVDTLAARLDKLVRG